MKFTDLFIKRPVLAMVVSLVILIAGLQSIRSLSVRQYPRSDIALVSVSTVYVGANADLVPGVRTGRTLGVRMLLQRHGPPFAIGAACDRLHHEFGNHAPPPVTAGLYRCAVDHYVRAAAGKSDDPDAYDAAARLAKLLDAKDPRRARLLKKFSIKQPMLFDDWIQPELRHCKFSCAHSNTANLS